MQKYVLVYRGHPDFENREEGANHMEAWRAWSAGLGDHMVDPGMPVSAVHRINPNRSVTAGDPSDPLAGVTIIQAESMEQAVELASKCPHLDAGGSMEVAEAMDMEM
ncbi:hypothetical protein RSK20926_09929 [Roseobacter sp. SK209-2-6]|uniref:YciI family protein n=1 Tax=Roseobacter sp. SK209-2-6 TaxID=388739 RepID=UPI0000F3CDF4|nr:YciI family protein [Roseobacter sp. SK209-2-6]EBA14804.1 hypothetical protein RSK20926_09929 [Roseobacter sp. SK209-2-6]